MPRMILDLPLIVQLAIRLRAVKANCTTGDVVRSAIEATFSADMEEARTVIAERETDGPIIHARA